MYELGGSCIIGGAGEKISISLCTCSSMFPTLAASLGELLTGVVIDCKHFLLFCRNTCAITALLSSASGPSLSASEALLSMEAPVMNRLPDV